MTFHLTGGEDPGRVVLECDLEGCGAQFTIGSVAARKTREAAAGRGWRAATREDRRDFCPDHVSGEAVAKTPEPREGQCLAHFWMSESRCEKDHGHDGMHTVKGFASWGDDLTKWEGLDEFIQPGLPAPTGGLLDLLEEAAR